MPVIESEAFNVTCDVSSEILLSHEVRGFADAPEELDKLERFDHDVPNVITALTLDINGVISELEIGVAGGKQSRKFPANILFKDAPTEARLRLNKLDFRQFKFGPSRCFSEWVPSSELDWTIMKKNNMKSGTYENSEHAALGIVPWSSRLHVSTSAKPHEATLRLVAVPVANLNNLPGIAIGAASEGYPTILLGEFSAVMAGELESPWGDGLPFYPVSSTARETTSP